MSIDGREMRGRQICEKGTEIERLYEGGYRVASQSGQGFYSVLYSPSGDWWCSCLDHANRTVKCKHIWAVEFSVSLRKEGSGNKNRSGQGRARNRYRLPFLWLREILSEMGFDTTKSETFNSILALIVAATFLSIQNSRR